MLTEVSSAFQYWIAIFESEDVTNRERESAWRMVIDYRRRDIAFIGDRMLLFVNGKYIPRRSYESDRARTNPLHPCAPQDNLTHEEVYR